MPLLTGRVTLAFRRMAVEKLYQVMGATHRFVRKHPAVKCMLRPAAHLVMPSIIPFRSRYISRNEYQSWMARYETITPADDAAIRADITRFPRQPLLSVVVASHQASGAARRATIASLQAQVYENWELCLVDGSSGGTHVASTYAGAAPADPRMRVIACPAHGGISAISNAALRQARGEWVTFLEAGDLLPPDALYELAAEILDHPGAQVIYTDEDRIDAQGNRNTPYFKPDFDPDLLLGQNLLNHLTAYRRDLLLSIGGFREEFEGVQGHDLALRVTAACGPEAVRHIARVLYHQHQPADGQPVSQSTMRHHAALTGQAVTEHLAARGIEVTLLPAAGSHHRIVFPVPEPAPLVSVLIPTRNRANLLRVCLEGLLNRTDYPALEVLVADNGSTEPDALALLRAAESDPRVRVLDMPGPFNFARITNQAAAEARGEILLLLNNDIEVIDSIWLREMVSHALRPDVGAVGCRLLYPNGRLQHGGTVLGIGGVGGHLLVGARREDPGPFGTLGLLRSAGAVTAACLALRREVWQQVGGMDEANLAVAFNDVDLCLKIRRLGLRIVCTPFAELYHHESASRGQDRFGEKAERFRRETDFMITHWRDDLLNDPYYNPNYTLENPDCTLASPPRRERRYRKPG